MGPGCKTVIGDRALWASLPTSINHTRYKMCATEVLSNVNGVSPPDYEKYFKRLDHCKGTHRNYHCLLLPQVTAEAGRKTLAFLGAKIFNKFPSNMKTELSIVKFKTACKDLTFDF